MKLFYRIKRDGQGLWVKMYSDCPFPWYAANRLLVKSTAKERRLEAKEAFAEFVAGVKEELGRRSPPLVSA